jgi:DNA-directed RNA polymerase specialized sigma24 family protein
MARDALMEARLQRWAEYVTVGDGSGYAATNVLHEDWSPPSPGQRPTLKVCTPTDARETARAVNRLHEKMQHVAVVHYIKRGPVWWQAEQLQCQPDTVHQRVERLHAALLAELCNNHEPGQNPAT